MLKLLLCLTILVLPAQSNSPTTYIGTTVVYSDYGSIYILRLAHHLIPHDRQVKKSDIACLIEEAKNSGIFSDVQTRIEKEGNNDVPDLIVIATPDPKLKSFVINEITLEGFPEVDKEVFQSALDKHDVRTGGLLAKSSLNELMSRITEALQEAYKNGSDKDDMELPWITIRPTGTEQVKLIVSPAYAGCEASRGK